MTTPAKAINHLLTLPDGDTPDFTCMLRSSRLALLTGYADSV